MHLDQRTVFGLEESLLHLKKNDLRLPRIHADLARIALFEERTNQAEDCLNRAEESRARATRVFPQDLPYLYGFRGELALILGLEDRARYWGALEQKALASIQGQPVIRRLAALHSINLSLFTERYENAERECDRALGAIAAEDPTWRSMFLYRRGIARVHLELLDPARKKGAESDFRAVIGDPAADPKEIHGARGRLAHLLLNTDRRVESAALLESIRKSSAPSRESHRATEWS